ncbi:hypothetical protein ACLBSJ_31720, partial [Klebsiella pneumoniae]|uniref:hypothetical protein n=1 Tax=Klebsiella pneumoniae TaxID=573 RepID=UPI003968659B
ISSSSSAVLMNNSSSGTSVTVSSFSSLIWREGEDSSGSFSMISFVTSRSLSGGGVYVILIAPISIKLVKLVGSN